MTIFVQYLASMLIINFELYVSHNKNSPSSLNAKLGMN